MLKARHYDVIVLGGGAAGLMCALTAGKRGKRVLLLEASNKFAKKILMSGGGRCNFTNLEVLPEHFMCRNPHFVKSALSQYTQWDFIALVAKHGIAYHEKSLGQLFCDNSAKDIVAMLLSECAEAGVELLHSCETKQVTAQNGYTAATSQGDFTANALVVATGGLSIPTLGGATGFGYRLAEQFGLKVHPTEASLVPFTLSGKWQEFSAALTGVALPVIVSVPNKSFSESMLFTHRGLSGPSILQISNYWHLGEFIELNLIPHISICQELLDAKSKRPQSNVTKELAQYLPNSLLSALQPLWWADKPLHEFKNIDLDKLAEQFHHWQLKPSGTEGYRTAEVTRGGVDVAQISSKTLQVQSQPGLFIIGEVLDVTGHLGGFNFQWAWSSGYVAGVNL